MDEKSELIIKNKEPPERRMIIAQEPSAWKDLGSLLLKILAIVIIFVLIFTFIYGFYRNIDPDMNPAIKDGDIVIYYQLDKNYAINDLVVVKYEGKKQVRRVVARAGDLVDITDEGLTVNGAKQQEPNIYQITQRYDTDVIFPLTIQPGQIFVLGDARRNATDSRVYGAVNVNDTFGKVITLIRRRGF